MRTTFWFCLILSCIAINAPADPPNWTITPSNFQNSATVTGRLFVNGVADNNSAGKVAAFVNGDIRGVTGTTSVSDNMFYFLLVYSNVSSGETVTFKAYVAGEDRVIDLPETVPFVNGGGTGDPTNPFIWHGVIVHPPTDISLNNNTVDENVAIGTTIGAFSATDPDAGDTHSYSLVSGAGGTDNAAFSISGSSLQTAAALDFETKNSYGIRVQATDSGGGAFQKQFTISVNDVLEITLNADFSANPRSGNAPLAVTFTDISTAVNTTITNWVWDFNNDGTTDATGPGPHNFTYLNVGTYTAKLTVNDSQNRSDVETKSGYISVAPTPAVTADFSATPHSGNTPLTVTFTDQSTTINTTINSWQWDFDNNGVTDATGKGPHNFTYTTDGVYTVKLAVSDGARSDVETKADYISANPTPIVSADFSATPLSGAVPLLVTFTNLSSASNTSISSWQWDFDNNGVVDATGAGTHQFTYSAVGSYSVKLTVSNGTGVTDIELKSSYIGVIPAPSVTADFFAAPTSGFVPLTVTFFDQSSTFNTTITSWQWDFDSNGVIDATGFDTKSFTYPQVGSYTVTLIVSDSQGRTDTEVKSNYITVEPEPIVTANFSATPLSGIAPLRVTFTNLSTATGSTITTWQWDFDNNGVTDATGRGPHTFTYSNADTYTVKLTVQDNGGRTDAEIKNDYIQVRPKPVVDANFSGSPLTGFAPLSVTFTDQSTAANTALTSWQWDFDNNGVTDATGRGPHTHVYPQAGSFAVKLIAGDGQTASDTTLKANYITVQPAPTVRANFSVTPTTGFAPLQVTFRDLSTATGTTLTSWRWDFDNNGVTDTTGIGPHLFTYANPGIYTVRLIVSNGVIADTLTRSNAVTVSGLTADFSATPRTGYAPLSVTFTDQSVAVNTTITTQSWDFDDDGQIDATTIGPHTFVYAAPGTYSARLIVSTATQIDIELKRDWIVVREPPVIAPDFTASPDYGLAPLIVRFSDASVPVDAAKSWQWDFDGDGVTDATGAGPHTHTFTQFGAYSPKLTVSNGLQTFARQKAGAVIIGARWGDLNGDGAVNMQDVIKLVEAIVRP